MTKDEKRNLARKNAEAQKAMKKAGRTAAQNTTAPMKGGKKGKSLVPQSKTKK